MVDKLQGNVASITDTPESGLENCILKTLSSRKKETNIVVFPHDDDLISLYGLLSKNRSYQDWLIFILGNGDTNGNDCDVRKIELNKALDMLKINDHDRYFFASQKEDDSELFSEKKIYEMIYKKHYDEVNYMICEGIIRINEVLESRNTGIDRIFTTAYQGGNLTHDLASFMSTKLGDILNIRTGKKPALIECAQYELEKEISGENIEDAIKAGFVSFIANSFHLSGQEKPFNDIVLEVYDGISLLDSNTVENKNGFLRIFESQYLRMIKPMYDNTVRFNQKLAFVEKFKHVEGTNRYVQQPHKGVLGYTLHKKATSDIWIDHSDFRNVIEEFREKDILEIFGIKH